MEQSLCGGAAYHKGLGAATKMRRFREALACRQVAPTPRSCPAGGAGDRLLRGDQPLTDEAIEGPRDIDEVIDDRRLVSAEGRAPMRRRCPSGRPTPSRMRVGFEQLIERAQAVVPAVSAA